MTEKLYTQEDMDNIEKENTDLRLEIGAAELEMDRQIVVNEQIQQEISEKYDCGSQQVNRSELACQNISSGQDACLTCRYEQLKRALSKG